MPPVYAGKFLRIDLSTGAVTEDTVDDLLVRQYLLGSGYAAKLFFDEMDPDRPWESHQSIDGVQRPAQRHVCTDRLPQLVVRRSPLTGIWGEANMGGHWGAELRFAGYDGLVITGRADRPVTLWIDGTKAWSTCGTRATFGAKTTTKYTI